MSSLRRMPLKAAAVAVAVSMLAACSGGAGTDEAASGEFQPDQPVNMMVPFNAGGGVDLAGRTVARILQDQKIVADQIDVENVSGGNGLVGMTRLKGQSGANNALMVTGAHIVATPLLTPGSGVAYSDFTPLAAIYTEYCYLLVRADSDIKDVADLAARLKADPASVSMGGAVTGGASNLSVIKFVDSIGVDPKAITYVPYDGDDALPALLGGSLEVASAGPEALDLVEAGQLRAITVSSPEPVEGSDIPTWSAAGSDGDFLNFRMVSGPPDMSQEAVDYWKAALTKMNETPEWKTAMTDNRWAPFFETTGLEDFLAEQSAEYKRLLEMSGVSSG